MQIAEKLLKFIYSVPAVRKDDLMGRAETLHQSYKAPFLVWSLNCWEDHGLTWDFQLDVGSTRACKYGSAQVCYLNIKDSE